MQFSISLAVVFLAASALAMRVPLQRRCDQCITYPCGGCTPVPPCEDITICGSADDPVVFKYVDGLDNAQQQGSPTTKQKGLANLANVLNPHVNVNLDKVNVWSKDVQQNSQTNNKGGSILNS